MWSRWFNSSSPEGVRRDVCATVVLSVLGLGVRGLWEGEIGSGLASLCGRLTTTAGMADAFSVAVTAV
jgi:hypothetical protein